MVASLAARQVLIGQQEEAAAREHAAGAAAIPSPGTHVDSVAVSAVEAATLWDDSQSVISRR